MESNLLRQQLHFVNKRFGMFIHFNSATFQFHTGEISDWEYAHENRDNTPRRFPFRPADWNPSRLDCAQWAEAAKSAGMTFAALTAKHHEGFCLWPTKETEHCVGNGTVKTDVVAAYLEAFRARGIEAGLYYSILDLTRGIGKRRCTAEDIAFTKAQITELLTGYGRIPYLIIDGWNAPWGGPSYETLPFEEIDALVKGLQPDCLLMNIGEGNIQTSDIVFYENAAGQKVDEGFQGPGAGCNYLTGCWFWRADDSARELRTAAWVVDTVEEMSAHNVSFLLNGSPNTDGLLDNNVVERFAEIGALYRPAKPLAEIPAGWLTR